MLERTLQRFSSWLIQKSGVSLANWGSGGDLSAGKPDQLRQPYKRSAWVRSAINKISGPVSTVSVDFYLSASAGQRRARPTRKTYRTVRGLVRMDDEPVEVPALESFLHAPMKNMGWSDFVEATIGWRKLAGESFWLLTDAALLPFPDARAQVQVLCARPDRMQHVVEAGELVGWVFTDGAGRRFNLLPEQVIHLKSWNPYDDFRGLGEYEAAQVAAETDWLSGKFARNVMANNGDTGPYIVAKSGIPTDEQRLQIVADLRAKRAAQQRGEFRPVFLNGDITVEDPKLQTLDAAAIANRIENRHEIYIAFGIPPSMADVKAAYSIGSASDFYQLILNTCIPEGCKLADGLQQLAFALTGTRYEVYLDWDEHPVMQEVRKERLTSVDTLWTKGAPMAVIDEYLALGLPDYPGKDIGYLPFSVSPAVAASTEPAPAPEADPALAEDPIAEMMRALRTDHRSLITDHSSDVCGCSLNPADLDQKADKQDVARWRELMVKRRATTRAFESRFTRELMAARVEVLRRIESGAALLAFAQKAAATDFIFDLAKFKQGLTDSFQSLSRNALDTAGQQMLAELGKDDPFTMPPAKALTFLQERRNLIAGAADDIHAQVMGTLTEGLNAGDTMKQLSDRVRAEFNGISERRGRTIASTETGAAYATARQEGMRSAGVKYKRWLVSGNANTRAAHKLMNGATVGIDEKFLVINPKTGDTDEVDGPSDPNGEPWNIINCHCVAIAEKNPPQGEAEPSA